MTVEGRERRRFRMRWPEALELALAITAAWAVILHFALASSGLTGAWVVPFALWTLFTVLSWIWVLLRVISRRRRRNGGSSQPSDTRRDA